jgi:hypothetical protein
VHVVGINFKGLDVQPLKQEPPQILLASTVHAENVLGQPLWSMPLQKAVAKVLQAGPHLLAQSVTKSAIAGAPMNRRTTAPRMATAAAILNDVMARPAGAI